MEQHFGTVSTREKPELLLTMSAKYADKTLDQLKRSRSAMLGVITKISNEAQALLKKEKSNLLDEDIDLLNYWKRKLETKVEEIAHLIAALVEVTPDNDADMERELQDAENAERKSGTLLEAVSRILEQFEETDASLTPIKNQQMPHPIVTAAISRCPNSTCRNSMLNTRSGFRSMNSLWPQLIITPVFQQFKNSII